MKSQPANVTEPDERLKVDPTAVRRTVLTMLHRSGASHLGSSMSLIEMLVAAYGSVDVEKIRTEAPDRSRILVSKGHGAAATYATLHHFGLLGREDMESYHLEGSVLAGHVSHSVPGVEHSTGALGHGLPVACGIALGLRSRGYRDASVFALLGDGEIQEGSVWESLMYAHHHNLSNLIPMVDNNRISSITRTDEVINMTPLADRFTGFGFTVHEVDGHDVRAITAAIIDIQRQESPGVIICNTIKGYGVPFAEGEPIWHYRSLSDDLYKEALAHLDGEEDR